ncbi:DUF4164 family protein [Asticcacaulis sp. EMRT-3]|uniref:DUF4164 family protein n=1 Tax=Asticcacaulis sp. EMRT-3 TaxID=3040349 RepID=UPI0024AFAB47|nr:DUF4164 family protein [Asticcacaulis sp. EMRT-3]MDI7776298.1 DUF4164 family protein [Asticcacaulis sp. EMRT-3]
MEQTPQGHMNPSAGGGNLAVAVNRLDRALAALEARVRALQSGQPIPEYEKNHDDIRQEDYQRLLVELDVARAQNAEMAAAAEEAYAALGSAASEIRQLMDEEAA